MLARDKLSHKTGPRLRVQPAGWTRISESIGCFLLAAVLSGAGLPGEYAPLGVSLVGAAGMGWNGLGGLLGAIFGAFCFQGTRLGLRDAAAAILVFSVASSLLNQMAWLAALNGTFLYRVLMMVCKLLLLPLVVSITYEINRWAGRHNNWFTRILTAPGMWLQNWTTNEPDDSMIEIGIAAVQAVLPEEEGADRW